MTILLIGKVAVRKRTDFNDRTNSERSSIRTILEIVYR